MDFRFWLIEGDRIEISEREIEKKIERNRDSIRKEESDELSSFLILSPRLVRYYL